MKTVSQDGRGIEASRHNKKDKGKEDVMLPHLNETNEGKRNCVTKIVFSEFQSSETEREK